MLGDRALSTGAEKLGQPVPESYLVAEENSGAPQHTQAVLAGVLFIPVRAGERALGPMLPRDVELLGRELRAPFGVGFYDFRFGVCSPTCLAWEVCG